MVIHSSISRSFTRLENILIIGNGGRENSLAWAIQKNEIVKKVYLIPGNAGSERINKCERIKIDINNKNELLQKLDFLKIDLVVIGGKEYGTGSSRDWAAKGTRLLGVRVVLAESFERIHRSNLVGMGVLPLEMSNVSLSDLKLNGDETFNIGDLSDISSKPNQKFNVKINYPNSVKEISVISRIDTEKEVDYFKNDGILPYVFNLIKA